MSSDQQVVGQPDATSLTQVSCSPTSEHSAALEQLRSQIRKLEVAGRAGDARVISTGCLALDQRLPQHGLATGTINEWLTPGHGYGAEWLSLMAAGEACRDGGALVVIDPQHRFYPVSAAVLGIPLDNIIVLRKSFAPVPSGDDGASQGSLLWAVDQALRCPAVAAVWGPLGKVNERWLRRFQLSAEQSGATGMFVRPASVRGQPGWSECQWLVEPWRTRPATTATPPASLLSSLPHAMTEQTSGQSATTFNRRLHLRLLRSRGGPMASSHQNRLTLEIDFTTGKLQVADRYHESNDDLPGTVGRPEKSSANTEKDPLSLASQLAYPATGRRKRRA